MMKLKDILPELDRAIASGNTDVELTGVSSDSREIKEGNIYVAIKGEQADGNDYIESAKEAGAVAIISEKAPSSKESLAWVHVKDARATLAVLAHHLFGKASEELKVIGVTGTNGKTTVTSLLHHITQVTLHRAETCRCTRCRCGCVHEPISRSPRLSREYAKIFRG